MQAPENQLRRIHDKILLLAKQLLQFRKENEKLKEDNRQLTDRLQAVSQDAEKYKQQAAALQFSGNGMDAQEKKLLEKRLSLYVKEIDRCITILND
jgi:regulator of replication initiation timing